MPTVNIKRILLKKKFNDVVYDILPKTNADIVVYNSGAQGATDTTVKAEIDKLQNLQVLSGAAVTVQNAIERAKQEILGITDGSSIAQAFDTIKEIADFLGDESTANTFINQVATLQDYVADGWDDNGTSVAGLLTRVANIEDTTETKTTFTTDMVPEGTTYDRHYVTTSQLAKIGSSSNVVYYASESAFNAASDDINSSDLYMVEVTA